MHIAKKLLPSEGIDPYSPEGQIRLKEILKSDELKSHTPGRPPGVRNSNVAQQKILMKEEGIDPESPEGQRLSKKLCTAEKALSSEGIDPYSSEGASSLKECIKANRRSDPSVYQKNGRGRPPGSRSTSTIERENILKSFDVDINSYAGKRLMRKMHAAEKDFLSQGINPYSADGHIHLKSFVDGEMAFLSKHPQPRTRTPFRCKKCENT